jgi:SAM-dependent methyltransferase
MRELTLDLVRQFPQNGPTDPIAYYTRPLTGFLYRERINLGLRMLGARRFTRALEVGFGAGAVQVPLSHVADEVHGIDLDADPNTTATVLARMGLQPHLRQANVYELPYPAAHFDLVASFSVFEHLHEFERGLREVRRVLQPGGWFLLGMPEVSRMMEVGFRAIGWKQMRDHHVTTPRQVRARFDACGFRVVNHAQLTMPLPGAPGIPVYYDWLLEAV